MNQLSGIVKDTKTHEGITWVKLETPDGYELTSVIIENSESFQLLQKNSSIGILFKETEVIIAKGDVSQISIQNKLSCEIVSIKSGEILCQIDLRLRQTTIVSIITQNACNQLNLKKGDRVYALIKSNEVSLSVND